MGNETQESLKGILAGCGFMGGIHAQIYAQLSGVDLVAAVDANVDSSADKLKSFGTEIPVYPNLEEALANNDCDFVDICLPTKLHKTNAIQVIEAGKALFCEKPLALAHADAIDVVKLADDLNLTIQCRMSNRHRPDVALMKDLVGRGAIDRPQSLRATWFKGQGIPRTSRGLECGVIWHLRVHGDALRGRP